jgi:hypothetical protein
MEGESRHIIITCSTPTIEKVTMFTYREIQFFVHRYVVGENRVIFMLKDGAMAWEVKDFLVKQDRCEEVTIEGKSYPGKVHIYSDKFRIFFTMVFVWKQNHFVINNKSIQLKLYHI